MKSPVLRYEALRANAPRTKSFVRIAPTFCEASFRAMSAAGRQRRQRPSDGIRVQTRAVRRIANTALTLGASVRPTRRASGRFFRFAPRAARRWDPHGDGIPVLIVQSPSDSFRSCHSSFPMYNIHTPNELPLLFIPTTHSLPPNSTFEFQLASQLLLSHLGEDGRGLNHHAP